MYFAAKKENAYNSCGYVMKVMVDKNKLQLTQIPVTAIVKVSKTEEWQSSVD